MRAYTRKGSGITMAGTPDIIEGTWDEILRQSGKFNGHRLRVTILPEGEPTTADPLSFPPTGRYAARMRPILAALEATPPTPEEVAEAEDELRELLENLNENRRRDGAEPLF
jgi:hypothetical protein